MANWCAPKCPTCNESMISRPGSVFSREKLLTVVNEPPLCVICIDDITGTAIKACSNHHFFHHNCLTNWVEKNTPKWPDDSATGAIWISPTICCCSDNLWWWDNETKQFSYYSGDEPDVFFTQMVKKHR